MVHWCKSTCMYLGCIASAVLFSGVHSGLPPDLLHRWNSHIDKHCTFQNFSAVVSKQWGNIDTHLLTHDNYHMPQSSVHWGINITLGLTTTTLYTSPGGSNLAYHLIQCTCSHTFFWLFQSVRTCLFTILGLINCHSNLINYWWTCIYTVKDVCVCVCDQCKIHVSFSHLLSIRVYPLTVWFNKINVYVLIISYAHVWCLCILCKLGEQDSFGLSSTREPFVCCELS